jgi:GNAT superfamily N-acetyltransferase
MSDVAQIEIVREFDLGLIGRCRALDAHVYEVKYQTDEATELLQIRKNPRSRVVVHYQDDVVAYIEFIPLTPEGFELFLNTRDSVFDLKITEHLVSPWRRDVAVDVYIASMVVRPDMQSKGISMVLLHGFYQALAELQAEGHRLGRLGATGVSVPGRRFVQTMIGLPLAHAVPGGVAGAGVADDVVRYLAAFLDW